MVLDDKLQCEITKYSYQEGSFADKVHKYLRYRDFNNPETIKYIEFLSSAPTEIYLHFQGLLDEFEIHSIEKFKQIKEPQEIEIKIVALWNEVGYLLAQTIDPLKAEIFYHRLYELLLNNQRELRKRIHKGTPLHQIGWVNYHFLKNRDKAKKYIQLAFVEDLINDRLTRESDAFNRPAYRFLRDVFLLPQGFLKTFETEVKKTISGSRESELFFPEPVLLSFVTQRKALVRERSREIFLAINKIFAQSLLTKVEKAKTNEEKKLSLEDLMTYLFSTVEGFEVRRNVLSKDVEIDLLIRNLITIDPAFEEFGRYILVECKNWRDRVDAKIVRDFVGKLRFSDCKCGILVAKSGITGSSGSRKEIGAKRTILKEYHRDSIIIIVLDKKDLEKVINEEVDFLSLLLEKYEAVRFDTL